MATRLVCGRYDYAGFFAFISYALCSLSIPLTLVAMGQDLHFPLDAGGMTAGGGLHLVRCLAVVAALLLCGPVAGRFGKRISMGSSMLFMGAGVLLCALSPCYALLLPFLLIAGVGEGICEGVATPFVQDLHQDAPERYVNIAHSMWSVGTALCVLLTSLALFRGISWRIILGCCGATALLTALGFFWKETPDHRYPETREKTDLAEICRKSAAIFRVPRFWVYCLGMFMGAGAEFCLTFWAAAYMQLGCGAAPWIASLGTGAIACGMFLGRLGFGYWARPQYLKHILLCCGLGTLPLSLLLVLMPASLFPSAALFHSVLLGILFLCGIGIAPYWPTLQVYGVKNLPELDSTLLYIFFSATGIPGCGFFTWFMGVLGDRFGLRGGFLLIPASLVFFSAVIFAEGWLCPRRGPCIEHDNKK